MKFIEALVIICITMLLNVAVLMMLAAFRIHLAPVGLPIFLYATYKR